MLKSLMLLALAQVSVAEWKYAIDKKSCKDGMYDQVKFYMDQSQAQSQRVVDALDPYLGDPNNKPDDRILAQMRQLFPSDGVPTARLLHGIYKKVTQYAYQDVDIWADDYRQARDKGDLEIFCNADHVVEDPNNPEKNIKWRDKAQDLPVTDKDGILSLKNPLSFTMAVTKDSRPISREQPWPEHSPEYIAFHPRYMKKSTEKNSMLNHDRVEKAAYPSLWDKVKVKLPGLDFGAVDILATPELTMLHELTHLRAVADAVDSEGRNSYGWLNCVRLKSFKNADSLAYFALVVDLIQRYKYDVDDKGKLNKFS
ncbi:hypothetical protein VD0002_g6235 [Verticillium dahliae]|uniref:Lysine-specific metallo-endopeptidase domain-containing protein n=1 Tax=Verticillium dahliae TaxID=27337 RepID=A0A2J8E880_VERDA|nr:hypothetical protein VdG2_04041 [Verticillium dahliae VDG2]PNH31207.1 hypothetical protein BJF96_g5487 [Verticillium dahliae]PNH57706.1 hypothetical protein VD0003_g167 [Verticillium dahliae]PNH61625.1 hypothetical protein VD0002_g6235 [Verticillium dahliae]RXG46621.1 hypothetical protein VDGE_08152 [Verticillium dahliae]